MKDKLKINAHYYATIITIYLLGAIFLVDRVACEIAYGGIINNTEAIDCQKSEDVTTVAKFSIRYARHRFPESVPVSDRGKILSNYKTGNCTKLELIYSEDDREPTLFSFHDPNDPEGIIESTLYWGAIFRLQIKWPGFSHHHSFIVNQYKDKLYIYRHTVHYMEKSSQTCALKDHKTTAESQQTSDLSSINGESKCSVNQLKTYYIPSHLQKCSTALSDDAFCDTFSASRTMRYHAAHTDEIQSESVEFRILSYNIWNTNSWPINSYNVKPYKKRLKQMAELCNSSDADIIGFQEVRFEDGRGGSLGPSQVSHLANLLPQYQFVYEPAQIQKHGIPRRIEEGVAIFSRYPIIDHHVTLLTRDHKDVADTHQRILLEAMIDIPLLGPIHVFNTHLSLSHVARQRSVQEIWSRVRHMTSPVFIMGDFNAEAHNDEVKFLSGEVELGGEKTQGLHDVWIHKHGNDDPGFTFSTLHKKLDKRIDLIFMKEHEAVQCTEVNLVDDGGRKEKAASDHLGLLATFKGYCQNIPKT